MNAESQIIKHENIENIARSILKSAEKRGDKLLEAFAHEALGRIFFERGMFLAALAQFEEALSKFMTESEKTAVLRDEETYAKLNAWIGISALRTNEFKKAIDAFKKAINILSNISENSPILGELKALLGDALSYTSPEEATHEFEEAHELMLRNPSPLLISNGLKLFAALVFRRYYNEAASILNEVSENLPRSLNGLNLAVYLSFTKIYKNIFLKAASLIELTNARGIQDLLHGIEGIKGIYFILRSTLKPIFRLRDLESYNQALIFASRFGSLEYFEEMLEQKKRLLKMYDMGNFSGYKAGYKLREIHNCLNLTVSFDSLIQKALHGFERIFILSFLKLLEPNQYLLIALDYPLKEIALVRRIEIEAENILKEDINTASRELELSLPQEVVEFLKNLDCNDLLFLSLDGVLHELPWELLPSGDQERPYLGLVTNIIRLPTLYQIYFWNLYEVQKKEIALVEIQRNKNSLRKFVEKALKKKKYRVFSNVESNIYILMTEYMKILHYSRDPFLTLSDEPLLKIGSIFLSPIDIERLDLYGDVVILDISNSTDIIEDEVGYHNLPISFLMAGFTSVIAVNGEVDDAARLLLAKTLYENKNKTRISDALLTFRKTAFETGADWWYRVVLYGNPHIRI